MRVPVLILALALGAGNAHATMRNFSFRRPTPLTTIFETFAKLGDFNVIVAPSIRGNMTLELAQVSPRDAMNMVAQIQGIKVHLLRHEGKETYMLAPADVIYRMHGNETRIVRLRHQPVEAIFETLSKSFTAYEVRTQMLSGQNTLILQGDSEGLNRAESVLRYADIPAPLVQVDIRVERDGKPVWKTSLKGRSGHEVKAVVGPEDDGRSSPSYLTVSLNPRVGPDRRVALDAAITLAPRRDELPEREIFNQVMTAAEVAADQYLDLASIEAPNGQVLKFRVMVSLLDQEPSADLDQVPLSAIDLEPGATPGPSTGYVPSTETLGNTLPSSVDVIDIDADEPAMSPPVPRPLEGEVGDLGEPQGQILQDGYPMPLPGQVPGAYVPGSGAEPPNSDDLGDLGDLGDI